MTRPLAGSLRNFSSLVWYQNLSKSLLLFFFRSVVSMTVFRFYFDSILWIFSLYERTST